jgi:hypothetical protein
MIYNELPVFKTAYELLRTFFRVVSEMERTYRFTLGERIIGEMTDLMLNIYRANSRYEKFAPIQVARENLEAVRLLLRVAFDESQCGLKRYIALSEELESVSKQLTAWGKSCEPKKDDNQV